MPRITIACPASHISDGNALTRCLGASAADDRAFGAPIWEDVSGNLYACASHDMAPEWVAALQAPLGQPSWGADMAGAGRARSLVVYNPAAATRATPGRIAVVADLPGWDAVAAMGLTQIAEGA